MDNFLISGLVEFISESSEKYIGYSPEDIQGNRIFNYIHPSDHSRFGCHLMHQQAPPSSNTDPDKAKRNFTCRFKVLLSSIKSTNQLLKKWSPALTKVPQLTGNGKQIVTVRPYRKYTIKDLMAGIEEVRKGKLYVH